MAGSPRDANRRAGPAGLGKTAMTVKKYEYEVDGRLHRTRDEILDGRQIRSEAKRNPPSAFILIEAVDGATRSIGLEERVRLNDDRRKLFWTFPGDRTFSFTVDERGWEWGDNKIAETDVRLIGNVADDLDLILDGDTDMIIERGSSIELGGKDVERIRTRPSPKTVTIVVNGRDVEVAKGPISFEQLIAIAYPTPPTGENVSFTVTYRRGPDSNPEGSLTQGHSVRVKNGMVFNVRATDKS